MKKVVKFVIAVICLASISFYFYTDAKKSTVNQLALENINALAETEWNNHIRCYGVGNLDCNGLKVDMIFPNLR
jgi:uncharacterized protein YxeA